MNEEEKIKSSQIEQGLRVLEYLRQNTDEMHPVTQAQLRKDKKIGKYIPYRTTFNANIVRMAEILNNQEDGRAKEEKDWRIVYEGLKLDDTEDGIDDDIEDDDIKRVVGKLYYNPIFDYDEIDAMIEGIQFSKTLTSDVVNELVKKIEENLVSKYYKKGPKKICTGLEIPMVDKEHVRANLLTIQDAIEHERQIEFTYCKYNKDKKLISSRETKDRVSPYYILANAGKYYLLACKEFNFDVETIRRMSIWRIEMMTDIEMVHREDRPQEYLKVIEKKDVVNLPQAWDEKFLQSHINMSYDEPISITLKIHNLEAARKHVAVESDFTFLYDWFGDTFTYISTDKEYPYDDIVRVKCSPYGMVNWALQYSDRVEVLEPETVRNQVIKKLQALHAKYGVVD